jgi:hypothetical protein
MRFDSRALLYSRNSRFEAKRDIPAAVTQNCQLMG